MTEANVAGQIINQSFRPRARVLQLLGDELIGSPSAGRFRVGQERI